jgi:hypothetical protein
LWNIPAGTRDWVVFAGKPDWISEMKAREVPGHFLLHQNYPNPFNPSTTIGVSLPESSDVQLTVFDLSGRQIFSATKSGLQPGYHTLTVDASSWSSGVYLYRVSAGNQVAVKKMVLVK